MSDLPGSVRRLVLQRARERCEYCLAHQSLQVATFHFEHIVPTSAGGTTEPSNLAIAYPTCNLHKADRIAVHDTETQISVPLFHPRLNSWQDRFVWSGHEIVGRTTTGRATVAALQLNHPRRLKVRVVEETFGLFPPD